MESGGKSSWANQEVAGFVVIAKYEVAVGGEGLKTTHYDYYVSMTDGTHGIKNPVLLDQLARSNVLVAGAAKPTAPATTAKTASVTVVGGSAANLPLCSIA